MGDYSIQFRTLAAASGWNVATLITAYRQGLSPLLRLQIVIYKDTMGLENLIQHSIQVTQCLSACQQDSFLLQSSSNIPSAAPPAPLYEPMQVVSFHLSPAERQRHIQNSLCLYCGSDGHLIPECPVCPPRPAVSFIHFPPMIRTTISVTTRHCSVTARALLDSGSA